MGIIPCPRTPPSIAAPPFFLTPLIPLLQTFPLHAVFTDGSVTHQGNCISDLLISPYERKNTASGASAIVLLGSPDNWKACPPIIVRVLASAAEFPGLNLYEMEVLAQRIALMLNPFIDIQRLYSSDCQSAIINSVRAIIHSQLKRSLGSAPAGVILAGLPPSPNCHLEWIRSHPERREPSPGKWSYTDWGIFLADAAAEGDWTPFHSIFLDNKLLYIER
jgi:hypothetical protein